MSLILEALHRSDQERRNDRAAPGLQTRHGESVISDWPARWLLPGLAVSAGLLLLSWLLWGGSRSGAPALPAPAAAIAPIAAVPAPAANAPVPPIASASEQPGLTAAAAPAAQAPAPVSQLPVSSGQNLPVPAEVTAEVAELYRRAAAQDPAAAEPAAAKPAAAGPAETGLPVAVGRPEAVLPVDAIVVAAQQELAAPPPDEHSAPLLQHLPQRTKDEIPSIFFSTHSWSNKASEKLVTLNGEIYREGDAVLPGVRLIEILPESILLDFKGTRFRLRALNSWVNF